MDARDALRFIALLPRSAAYIGAMASVILQFDLTWKSCNDVSAKSMKRALLLIPVFLLMRFENCETIYLFSGHQMNQVRSIYGGLPLYLML